MSGIPAALLLDLALLGIIGWYAASGRRDGLAISLGHILGFLGGAALGMSLVPMLVDNLDRNQNNLALRASLLVSGVIFLSLLGHTVGGTAGRHVRKAMRVNSGWHPDHVLGMLLMAVSASAVLWFLAGAGRTAGSPELSRAIGESRVMRVIDAAMPEAGAQLFSNFQSALAKGGVPRVFQGLHVEPITPIEPPDPNVAHTPGVDAAAASVIKLTVNADKCGRAQEGSGWVVSPQHVVTNAHVVAGASKIQAQVRGTGPALVGRLVAFDPQRDLAVVYVPRLQAKPLATGGDLQRGQSAVVAGFPEDGPYDLRAARLRSRIDAASGQDIYGKPGAVRQIYSLNAYVRHGNSGGPLLDPEGRVVGVIFAKSLDDANTGYALTLKEALPVIDPARTSTNAVPSGECSVG